MIPTLLILSCLAPIDKPARLQTALRQMNRMAANCHHTDNGCIAYILQSGVIDKAYKVRLTVESVEASPDEKTTIINGIVRIKRAGLTDYRTPVERQAIQESLAETRRLKKRHEWERKREQSRSPRPASPCGRRPRCRPIDQGEQRRRRTETRARQQEHRHLLEQLNESAEARKTQVENVAIKIMDDEHYPQDYENGQRLNCIVRIESFTLRPEVEEFGSPKAIDKLFAQLEEVTLKKKSSDQLINARQ
ncbi:MAG: hypothetical protein DHS20C16_17010 [Phycisphaerae bacterium]|nr:MAG: hypothetical protein DHS20C16_17010 [Phycisphaerae bacterium]